MRLYGKYIWILRHLIQISVDTKNIEYWIFKWFATLAKFININLIPNF